MSADIVAEVMTRALDDEAFASQLKSDPSEALSGYELTEEEKSCFAEEGSELSENELDSVSGGNGYDRSGAPDPTGRYGRAFSYLSRNMGSLSGPGRARLNSALARGGPGRVAIPCTGWS